MISSMTVNLVARFEFVITLKILKIERWDFHIRIPGQPYHLEPTSDVVTFDPRFESLTTLLI